MAGFYVGTGSHRHKADARLGHSAEFGLRLVSGEGFARSFCAFPLGEVGSDRGKCYATLWLKLANVLAIWAATRPGESHG